MTFDFDSVTNRRGTGSEKWNVRDGELPMWVADMDFPTAPAVREVIELILKSQNRWDGAVEAFLAMLEREQAAKTEDKGVN